MVDIDSSRKPDREFIRIRPIEDSSKSDRSKIPPYP